jgi:hypothetical protein
MAHVEQMDFTPFDDLDSEILWLLDLSAFSHEGFNATPPQLQPDQPQPEEIPTHDTTLYSNGLSFRTVDSESLRWNPENFSEGLPPNSVPRGSDSFFSVQTLQFDETPTSSSVTTMVCVNNTRSSKLDVSAPLKRLDKKRKLSDHTGCFPIRENPAENKRTRRAFDPVRRKKIAMLREVGACSRCKARRVEVRLIIPFMNTTNYLQCSFPGPCKPCKDAVESIKLAEHICIRQTLLNLRFGDTSHGRHPVYDLNFGSDHIRFSLPVLYRSTSADRGWCLPWSEENHCM